MIYKILDKKIIIGNLNEFNIEHIVECGQVFTYKKISNNDYLIYSKDQLAHVFKNENKYVIETDNVNYFINYFDLDTNYSEIKNKLLSNDIMTKSVDYGYGIRILKQDIYEVIIGFIISANNNIKRIIKSMQKLREFGEIVNDYHAFPTIDKLCTLTEEQFAEMGVGYRAKYLVETCKKLKEINIEQTFNYTDSQLREWLLSLQGVGPKVADCILLYGYHRSLSFPVDTWMEKVYLDIFKTKKSRQKMAQDFMEYFGNLSGYAQQYLFFYKRTKSKIQ